VLLVPVHLAVRLSQQILDRTPVLAEVRLPYAETYQALSTYLDTCLLDSLL
jgi:hypothetical protein